MSPQKSSYRVWDSIFLGHNPRKMRVPKQVLVRAWTDSCSLYLPWFNCPMTIFLGFHCCKDGEPGHMGPLLLQNFVQYKSFQLLKENHSFQVLLPKRDGCPWIYSNNVWSIDWNHSTAERPNKSPREEERFPGVHSYTPLNNWTRNSGSGIPWSQNPGKGQIFPGNQQKLLYFRHHIASLEIIRMWLSHKLSYKIIGCLKGKPTQGAFPRIFQGLWETQPFGRSSWQLLGPLLSTLAQGWEPFWNKLRTT